MGRGSLVDISALCMFFVVELLYLDPLLQFPPPPTFTILIFPFTIVSPLFAIYFIFCNLTSTLGANLYILEEEKIAKEKINIVKEEIKLKNSHSVTEKSAW